MEHLDTTPASAGFFVVPKLAHHIDSVPRGTIPMIVAFLG
jgi:hypothetical protein